MRSVAIVGRPNVGKSALFNRLAGRKIAIVHDQPGVTRDRVVAVCRLGVRPFEIVDTGGIGASPDPDFAEQTHAATQIAIESADLLLFVVDGQHGVPPAGSGTCPKAASMASARDSRGQQVIRPNTRISPRTLRLGFSKTLG